MLITALKTLYPTLAWNVTVVDISMWNEEVPFGLCGHLALIEEEREQMMAQ